MLQLSRILSRTALQLWIVKTSIENPILRRRRIAAAEADDDRCHSTPGNTAETSPRLTSAATVALDEASDPHLPSDDSPPSTTINLDCPQPYVNIPDTIGGNQSKRRRVGIEPSRPSPSQGVLSIPIIPQAEQATNRAIITSHHRDTVVRLPNTRPAGGGEYFLSKEDLLALGAAEYAEAQCIHALSELSLSSDPTVRWIPTDFYRCLATDSIQHTGYFPGRAQAFQNLVSSIFDPDVRITIFYIHLASHFVTVSIDNLQQRIKGYDSLHGYPGTPLPTIISNILRYIRDTIPPELRPPTLEQWPIITDAAQQEGLLKQTSGDCSRYVYLIASCITANPPISYSFLGHVPIYAQFAR